MSNVKLSYLLKISIIAIGVCGLCICFFWYPFSISLTAIGIIKESITTTQKIEFWTQLTFYWVVSIPCFYILVKSWKIVNIFKNKKSIFVNSLLAEIIKISKILILDIIIFFIGNIIFLIFGWNEFALLYLLLAIIGIIISLTMHFVSKIIQEGINYKKESDGLI